MVDPYQYISPSYTVAKTRTEQTKLTSIYLIKHKKKSKFIKRDVLHRSYRTTYCFILSKILHVGKHLEDQIFFFNIGNDI